MSVQHRSLIGLAILALTAWSVTAGDLTPPGAPSGSSTEIAARAIPISDLPFTISVSGSYYATGNLFADSLQPGIIIETSNVTIDLNGFQISGFTGFQPRGTQAIVATDEFNITVRNGTVFFWDTGINLSGCHLSTVEDVRVLNVGSAALATVSSAIHVGDRSAVRRCQVQNNGARGIRGGDDCLVSDCVVVNCSNTGISLSSGSIVSRCTARDNGDPSIQLTHGISVGSGSVVESCTVTGSQGGDFFDGVGGVGIKTSSNSVIRDCVSTSNDGHGIQTGSASRITDCTAVGNGDDGINATAAACHITGNICSNNSGDGYQIGGASVMRENLTHSNDLAAVRSGPNPNLVIHNAMFDSASGLVIVGPGRAQTVSPPGGFDAGDVPNAWANFSP